MEIDLECLTNKYETEKSKAEERVRELEKQNSVLQSECDRVKQKLNDLLNSTGSTTNNNNLITNNKNLPCDLGEGVRSTIVTFNNAIASMASSTVANSCQQPRPNLVQSLQTKPSLAAKPSFDGSSTNGKVTIISTTGPSLQSGGGGAKSNEPPVNNVNSSTSSPTTTTCTSVASVVQKFTEFSNTISNNIPSHQPIVKKLSSSGLVANIAQGIVGGQQTTTGSTRGKPPPVPSKPVINSQLLKERTAKMMLEQSNDSRSNRCENSLQDKDTEKFKDKFENKLETSSEVRPEENSEGKFGDSSEAKSENQSESKPEERSQSKPLETKSRKKFVRANAMKVRSQGSK